MVNGLQIQTTNDYLILKIPRFLIPENILSAPAKLRRSTRKEKLTANKALKIFDKGKKEYQAGKLKPISSLEKLI